MAGIAVEYWRTALGAASLASFFDGLGEWAGSLRKGKPDVELETTTSSSSSSEGGKHPGLHVGMRALSAVVAAISTAFTGQRERDVAVMEHLVKVEHAEHHDPQLAFLKRAVDAMNDLKDGRHEKGHRKNVDLLEKACENAEGAARMANGNLTIKLQAYQIWIITAFWHEVVTKSCQDAKKEAMYILGRIILEDRDLLRVCERYARRRAYGEQKPKPDVSTASIAGGSWIWQGSTPEAEDIAVIKFLLEIMSSVTLLPPLDQDVGCSTVVKVVGAGMKVVGDHMELIGGKVILGPRAPKSTVLAMGRYCASNREVAQAYPNVSSLALSAWEQGKERLALDNFFSSTGGHTWNESKGWTDKDGELSRRFGVTVANGHVTKLCLADNNLQGAVHDDLADCEHLRELVLHGNNFVGGVPLQVKRLIKDKPDIIVTGLILDKAPETPIRDPSTRQGPPSEMRRRRSSHRASAARKHLHCRAPPLRPPHSASQRTVSSGVQTPSLINVGKAAPGSDSGSCTSSSSGRSDCAPSLGVDPVKAVKADEASLGISHPSRSSSEKSADSKSLSFSKRMGKFLRSSVGADFSVGFAQQCQFCGGELEYTKNEAAVCPTCSDR